MRASSKVIGAVVGMMIACAGKSLGGAREPLNGKPMFEAQTARLDQEIAARMVQKLDLPADQAAMIEIELDLRLVGRWLLSVGAGAPAGGDLQVASQVRWRLWREGISAVERTLTQQGGKLTPGQAFAATQLHRMTFSLPNVKQVRDLDGTCQALGQIVMWMVKPDYKEGDAIPAMRPAPAGVASQADRGKTPAQLKEEILRTTMPAPLRRQMAILAQRFEAEGDQHRTATELCLELARGMQSGALPLQDRLQMEREMLQALAFYNDPRLRSAGLGRLKALEAYRPTVSQAAKLNLTIEQQKEYAEFLSWARSRGREGQRAIGMVERFNECRSRFATREGKSNEMQALRSSGQELEKHFREVSDNFHVAVIALGRKPTATSPTSIEVHLTELTRVIDLLERLDRMPSLLTKLNTFNPKPYQGLEQRLVRAAVSASGVSAIQERSGADRYVQDLHRLGGLAVQLADAAAKEIPSSLQKRWTGGRLVAFDAKRRAMVTELACSLAAGEAADARKLARLDDALKLYASLQDGAAMDMVIGKSLALERWVDWRLGIDDLRPILAPYPRGLADAFAGFIADSPKAYETWERVERRYRPLAKVFERISAYSAQCEAMPTGGVGVAAGLMTPLADAPFALERQVAFAVAVWRHGHASDGRLADQAFEWLLARLGAE